MNNDKKNIIKYTVMDMLPDILLVIIFSMIVSIILSKINNEIKNYAFLLVVVTIVIVLLILIFRLLNIIISSDIKLTDGYIDKIRFYSDSDNGSRPYGQAVTLDGSKTTREQRISFYFVYGKEPNNNKIPVKILIRNNQATKFFITKESYNYVKDTIGKTEKIGKKIYTIIAILVLILALIYIFFTL